MKKSLILLLSLAIVLVCSAALLVTGAFAEEQEITISYAKAHDTTDTTTNLDTKAYEGGKQTVKAGESFTLPTTADISQLSEEGYVLVWYTEDGRTYKAGQSVSFDKDTKLFRAAAKEVNNIADLNTAMTSGSTCAILTADITAETSISVYGQGASTLFLNGFTINLSINSNAMGAQRSGKHILGEGTVNITNPNGNLGEYAVFQCQSHGYNGSANKGVIGRDVTINAPNFYLAVDGDGSFNNHYPWIRVYGTVNVYGMFKMTNAGSRAPFMEIFDTANVTGFSFMFDECTGLKTLDVTNFNTSKAVDMAGMFSGCWFLEKLDLSNFHTENVTDMSFMFCNCVKLTDLNISNFDTASVTDMTYMFYDTKNLQNLDLSRFDVSNVAEYEGFMKDGVMVNGRPWEKLFTS